MVDSSNPANFVKGGDAKARWGIEQTPRSTEPDSDPDAIVLASNDSHSQHSVLASNLSDVSQGLDGMPWQVDIRELNMVVPAHADCHVAELIVNTVHSLHFLKTIIRNQPQQNDLNTFFFQLGMEMVYKNDHHKNAYPIL